MVNRILLTGAGFTANFGTPLSADVSDHIFNIIDNSSDRLRELLKNNYDYEDIYQQVMFGDEYTQEEKNLLNSATRKAYEKIDNILVQGNEYGQTYFNLFKDFILRFSNKRHGAGYIFTLNQDLFMERKFNLDATVQSIELPGVGSIFPNGNNGERFKKISLHDSFETEKNKYEQKLKSDQIKLAYIKLHGSYDWIENDSNLMVIGSGKNKQISLNPLLKWYFDLFQVQLNLPQTKLFIIGYGFNDEHINQALANAKDNLKITILHVKSRSDFMDDLLKKPYGNEIRNLISKFYKLTLFDLFPKDHNSHSHPDWKEIQKEYFGIQEPFLS